MKICQYENMSNRLPSVLNGHEGLIRWKKGKSTTHL